VPKIRRKLIFIISCFAAFYSANNGALAQSVRTLPGALNDIVMFNSNSPEVVRGDGILLSTFPPEGKKSPEAHLNYLFQGRFDLFAHHINNTSALPKEEQDKTLYICALVNNPGTKQAVLEILQGASYLSLPDAPFVNLSEILENPNGDIYAGPGDRVMTEFLLGKNDTIEPKYILIDPGQTKILFNLPIPVSALDPPLNGRSILYHLYSKEPLYMAALSMFSPSPPLLEQWQMKIQKRTIMLCPSALCGP